MYEVHEESSQRLKTFGCGLIQHMPVRIKELTNIQRLSEFVVGKNDGAKIGELGKLNLLGWKLTLSRLENVGGLSDAQSVNLKDKINLMHLELHWLVSGDNRHETNEEDVLEGLEPNSGLRKLCICGYMGTVVSLCWLVKLRNLTSIRIVLCRFKQLPALGKLPSLKIISLENMFSLESFHNDDNAISRDEILFSILQELLIRECSLVSLPSNFPKLKYLRITNCDRLHALPYEIQNFKDLDNIEIYGGEILSKRCEKGGEDWPKISHIPHLYITKGIQLLRPGYDADELWNTCFGVSK